ncbi:hypothetical protein D3C76_1678510 [compost metagenome]
MIVHHIHHDRDVLAVQRLHHFLEFRNTPGGFRRIRAVRAFGSVIVLGIVAPVIPALFSGSRTANRKLVHRLKIEYRHKMNMRDAKLA